MPGNLFLLRHGQSSWNQANQFTGWTDVDLTSQGKEEARRAGQFLLDSQAKLDIAYTSLLKRAIRTLDIVLDELDQLWMPVQKTWLLNERHYGALQGLNKAEIADLYGTEQVFAWRRSFSIRPPELDRQDPRHPRFDPRYAQVAPSDIPGSESLQDTYKRVLRCWQQEIFPVLVRGQGVLIVAHGNSLRALVKHLERISDEEIPRLNIPIGIPIQYVLNQQGYMEKKTFLGSENVVAQALAAAAKAAQVKGTSEG